MMRRLVRAPPRHPSARHRGKHLARDHRDLHLCAGAVPRACRSLRPARPRCATPSASISASRCRSSATWARPAWSRRSPRRKGDLGLVPVTAGGGAWWSALEGDDAPKIIARLPFVERADHPAGLPVFAIARPHPDAIVTDVTIWSMRVSGWGGKAARAASALAELIAIPEGSFDGAALLVSVPRGQDRRRHRRRRCAAPASRCAAKPSSAATRPGIWSAPTARGRSRPGAERLRRSLSNVRLASATAPRRARYPGLCAGQEQRARRRQGLQAVVQRDAARPEPARDRGLSRGRPTTSRTIRTARRATCARRSAAPSGSTRRASSAAPARTTCSICWRAPISPTATRRSTPRTASWSIRSRRSAPARRRWSRRRRISPPTSMRSSRR